MARSVGMDLGTDSTKAQTASMETHRLFGVEMAIA